MLHPAHTQGGSVHVWGAIWYGGRSELQVLVQTVNRERYCEIIRSFIAHNQPPPNWILQQDNAPAHTSQVVRNFLRKTKPKLFHGLQSLRISIQLECLGPSWLGRWEQGFHKIYSSLEMSWLRNGLEFPKIISIILLKVCQGV